jgi:hypothetical protein
MPISQIYVRRIKWTGSSSPRNMVFTVWFGTPRSVDDSSAVLVERSVLRSIFAILNGSVMSPTRGLVCY